MPPTERKKERKGWLTPAWLLRKEKGREKRWPSKPTQEDQCRCGVADADAEGRGQRIGAVVGTRDEEPEEDWDEAGELVVVRSRAEEELAAARSGAEGGGRGYRSHRENCLHQRWSRRGSPLPLGAESRMRQELPKPEEELKLGARALEPWPGACYRWERGKADVGCRGAESLEAWS